MVEVLGLDRKTVAQAICERRLARTGRSDDVDPERSSFNHAGTLAI